MPRTYLGTSRKCLNMWPMGANSNLLMTFNKEGLLNLQPTSLVISPEASVEWIQPDHAPQAALCITPRKYLARSPVTIGEKTIRQH